MKIFANNAVYVQKNDLGFFTQTDLPIPKSIFMKVFGRGITIINDNNRYEFVKFEDQSEIEYFKGLDWIIDYGSVKDLTEEEIISLGNKVAEEKNCIASKFNAMSISERENNTHLINECEVLDFKMYSLVDIVLFQKGELEMVLPDGVEYPADYNKTEEKGLKKILKLFRK